VLPHNVEEEEGEEKEKEEKRRRVYFFQRDCIVTTDYRDVFYRTYTQVQTITIVCKRLQNK